MENRDTHVDEDASGISRPTPDGTQEVSPYRPYYYEDSTIKGGTVRLDNTAFVKTRLIGCTLVYEGGAPPLFDGAEMENCTFDFSKEAWNTIWLLKEFIDIGGEGIIEELIDAARETPPPGQYGSPPPTEGAHSSR